MKKIFKIKLENLQLIGSILVTLLTIGIIIIDRLDLMIITLLILCIVAVLYSIISYKHIRNFRKEVLRRW